MGSCAQGLPHESEHVEKGRRYECCKRVISRRFASETPATESSRTSPVRAHADPLDTGEPGSVGPRFGPGTKGPSNTFLDFESTTGPRMRRVQREKSAVRYCRLSRVRWERGYRDPGSGPRVRLSWRGGAGAGDRVRPSRTESGALGYASDRLGMASCTARAM